MALRLWDITKYDNYCWCSKVFAAANPLQPLLLAPFLPARLQGSSYANRRDMYKAHGWQPCPCTIQLEGDNEVTCANSLFCQSLDFPLLENKNEYVVHGYAYSNYLKELNPPGQVFSKGASLDKAFEGRGGRLGQL